MAENMSSADAMIAYTGPAVDAGEMDVRELAPALLALGEMCQEAARVLNGPEASLRVVLRANPDKGSFELVIGTVLSWKDTLLSVVNSPEYRNAKEILEALGLINAAGTAMAGGVFWLVKKFKGAPIPPGVSVQGNNNVVLVINGERVQVTPDMLKLYASPAVLAAADQVIEPVRHPGITGFEARRPSTREPLVQIGDADTEAFRVARVRAVGFLATDDEVPMTRRDVVLEVIKPAFHRGHRWMLTDGSAKYGVDMRDEAFWQRVDRGESFAKGDRLTVSLWTRTKTVEGLLKAEYFVDAVLAHVPRPRQLDMLTADVTPPG